MATLKNLFTLLLLGCFAVVVCAQASLIKSDLQTIDTDCKSYNTSVNRFNGSVANAVTVQQASDKVDSDIKKTTTDINNSPVASSADSQSIIAYINSPLEPDFKGLINALISKKTTFINGGYKQTVCDNLNKLKVDLTAMSNALVAKASSDQKTNAQAASNKLVADIQSGLTSYGC